MFRRRRMFWSWTRWFCFGIAAACFTWCGWVWLEQRWHQSADGEMFDESIHKSTEAAPPPSPQPSPEPSPAPREKIKGPIATLKIERLKVAGYVEEGFDARTLRNAIGHAPHSARPGEKGNIVLAGHRDTFFSGLQDAKLGDQITLQALDGRKFGYRISRIFIVDPTARWVMKSSPDRSMLTLITCYPFRYVGSAPKRLIVQAQPTGPLKTNTKLAQANLLERN